MSLRLKGGGIVNLAHRVLLATIVGFFAFGAAAFADGVEVTSTTANAIGVLISGTDVTLFVPNTTYNSLRMGSVKKIIEAAPGAVAIRTQRLKTGYSNSCAASPATGTAVCSGAFGGSYIVKPNNAVVPFKTGIKKLIHFTGGSCANCTVAIDDAVGQAIIATSAGYLPVQLTPPKQLPIVSTKNDVISGNFGYDPVNRRILSPNYQILNLKHFTTGPPHYQIIRMSDGAAFDLADEADFFNAQGTCMTASGSIQRDALPDSGAYDVTTGIAFGTFRSPADCVPDVVEDIALFDLTQATFDMASGTWSTSAKRIQTLSEMTDLSNGITGIAIVPGQHIALVADRREHSGGGGGFGALSLPTTSGSGTPSIQDWVQANLPDDPSGKPWRMSFEPNGLTAYSSPNTGDGMGVIINQKRTYAAVIDIPALLAASRQAGTSHTISTSVDLVGSGIVRFVDIRPGK